MGGEVPDKNPEPPVEAPATAETPEAQATREAAEKAKLEAGAKALEKMKSEEAADRATEDPEKELEESLAASETTTPEPEPAATPESQKPEGKSEGGIFNTISGGLASAMEPIVGNMLARTAERLKKDGTGDWKDSLSDTFLKALVQISLFLNPKAPWAEKLFSDEKNKDLFAKGMGMTLAKDADGNYSCTFDAVLQPEALPCSPANELLNRYLGEGTLSSEFTRGQSIKDLKDSLTAVAADSPEKAMADLMLKNINELGVDEKTTLGPAFKSGFGRNLEDRLALLTGDEQTLVTSSLARHATEAAPTEENALEALKLGEGITMESPLNQDLLTKLSNIDATGNEDVQKVKMLSSLILMGGPGRTTEQNSSLLTATATESEWKKAFDLKDGDVLPQLTEKLKDLDAATLLNGTLQDLLLASQKLKSAGQETAPVA